MLTLQLHLPPEYVMDKMEFFEIRALMKHQHYAHKDSWEQARMVAYIIAQVNSKKKLKPTDVMEFDWDRERDNTAVSNEEIALLRDEAKRVALTLQNEF